MSNHAHAPQRTNSGIDNRKMGFWLFLASECIFFATLIVAYLVYHHNPADMNPAFHPSGLPPMPKDIFNIQLTSVSTFVLLMSSLAVVLGVNYAQQGKALVARRWILFTAILGMIFLSFQVFEFSHFAADGLHIGGEGSSLFGTTFYFLTGFHGLHVAIGVLWLLSLWWWGRKGGLDKDKADAVEIGALYWHFVDVVWIVIFTVVYLLEFVQ